MPSNTLIVNLFGGPGCGKSTIAALTFSYLKSVGINCELVPEVAKDYVWDDIHFLMAKHPVSCFAEQLKRVVRLIDKVDVIVMDSPLLHYRFYQRYSPELDNLIVAEHRRYPTLNFWLARSGRYKQEGRVQDEKQAREVDISLYRMLTDLNVDLEWISVNMRDSITEIILDKLDKSMNGEYNDN